MIYGVTSTAPHANYFNNGFLYFVTHNFKHRTSPFKEKDYLAKVHKQNKKKTAA